MIQWHQKTTERCFAHGRPAECRLCRVCCFSLQKLQLAEQVAGGGKQHTDVLTHTLVLELSSDRHKYFSTTHSDRAQTGLLEFWHVCTC